MLRDSGIVYFADPRFPGGTTRAIVTEATALSHAGYRAGLCPVMGPTFRRSRDYHPDLITLLDKGILRDVDPAVTCHVRAIIVHHHALFTHLPQVPVGITADKLVLILHHPPFNGLGEAEYDLPTICSNLSESFGIAPVLAPVGPAVRAQLERFSPRPADILEEDWHNLIDLDAWKPKAGGRQSGRLTIGRHSRPQLDKFPETLAEALVVYPDLPDVAVRMLGAPPELQAHYGHIPHNWELLPFDAIEVDTFLDTLDYFVYYHAPQWVEAFGYVVLEAIAKGVPAILPPYMCRLFGSAAIYAAPQDVLGVIQSLESDPEKRAAHIAQAVVLIASRFGLEQFTARLERLFPGWRGEQVALPVPRPLRCVMMTSNGVGIGHLTRLLAIASHLPADTSTAFFTLSQSFRLAQAAGYMTQFAPYHATTGAQSRAWNTALAEELGDFLDLVRPDILVFDGGQPYSGLMTALNERRMIKRVWVSRALWPTEAPEITIRTAHFDLIIEPGEISGRFDTVGRNAREKAIAVAPIVFNASQDSDRDSARAELGIAPDAVAVGLMLGAGSNFDFEGIRSAIVQDLSDRPGVDLTEFRQPMALGTRKHTSYRVVSIYPASRVTAAFDFMITSGGYNSFHEAILHQIPTVFVPNEAAEMDRQILRARHARVTGCGELLRASDRIGLSAVMDRMFDPDTRKEMQRRMARLHFDDGAAESAALILRAGRMLRMVDPI